MGETLVRRVGIRLLRDEYASQYGGKLRAGDLLNVEFHEAVAWVGLGIAECLDGQSSDELRRKLAAMRAMEDRIRAENAQRDRERIVRRARMAQEQADVVSRAMMATGAPKSTPATRGRYGQGMVRGYLWSEYGTPHPWPSHLLDMLRRRSLRGATDG